MVNKKQRLVLGRIKLKQIAGVVACLKALTGRDYTFLAGWWEYLQNKLERDHGRSFSAKRLKDYYNFAVRIALEYPIEEIEPIPFTRTSGGIPKALRPYLEGLQSPSVLDRRAMLSILNSHELLTAEPVLKLDTILDSTKVSPFVIRSFRKIFRSDNFLKPITKGTLTLEDLYGIGRMYSSANSGPNGKAVVTAHLDAYALFNDINLFPKVASLLDHDFYRWVDMFIAPEIEIVIGPLKSLKNLLKRRDLKDILSEKSKTVFRNASSQFYEFLHSGAEVGRAFEMIYPNYKMAEDVPKRKEFSSGASHSVLRLLSDKSCKTRVVAVGDYWTQLALYPIHNLFFKFLKNIGPCDATYNHDLAAQRVTKWLSKGIPVWSFDLTAATDLFPRILSYELFAALDEDLAKKWLDVISDRKFNLSGRRRHTVKYGRGTPMGLLSSWPVFAVTHHAIVRACAHMIGIQTFDQYVIIGDDIVIADKHVADKYRRVMTVYLNCQISEAKSVNSSGGVLRGEIAKRIFLREHELSPLTPGAVREVRSERKGPKPFKILLKELAMLPFFLKKLARRQWFDQDRRDPPAQGQVMYFIDNLYHYYHHRSVRTKFTKVVLNLLSVPGALPASLMKSSPALVGKFKELFGDDFKQSLYIITMYYSNRTKSLNRASEDTIQAIKRFVSILESPYFQTVLGTDVVEHPLTYLLGSELSRIKTKITELNSLDVPTAVIKGGFKDMDVSVFSEAYISDEFKMREGDRSRLILRTLNVLSGKSKKSKELLRTVYQTVGDMNYGLKASEAERSFISVPNLGLVTRYHNCGRPL